MPDSIKTTDAFFAPLTRFYEQEKIAPLHFQSIAAEKLPEPQKHLLVHNRDMTTRLECHHSSPIGLKALYIAHEPTSYFREVLLIAEDSGKPVEYGAIEINLEVFPDELGTKILEGKKPLGGLLVKNDFAFISSPQTYFEVHSDQHIQNLLELKEPIKLYGRSNILTTPDGRAIASIVEILPSN
jgi:chorismate-pyruvate lyase